MTRFAACFFSSILITVPLVPQTNPERQFSSLVSPDTLREYVQTLSSFGNRWGGTPSGDRAAAWIAGTMRRFGLEVTVQKDPERLVFVNLRWRLRVVEPRSLRRLIRNDGLAGFSPSVPVTTAELVDPDVDDAELGGKAVLTHRQVTESLYDEIVRQEGVAILSYAPGDSTIYPDWAMLTPLSPSSDHPIPLYNISYRNGERLRRELRKGTTVRLSFGASTMITNGAPLTVVGRIRGTGQGRYIICAHGDSDSGGPGADDNASGVAGVLEMARVLSGMIRAGRLSKPVPNLDFVVWGSEYYSTEHFVQRERDSLHTILGVLNYDQIGTGASRNCVYFESNDVPHNAALLSVLDSVGRGFAGKRGFWEEATTNPSQGGTDSYVFLPDHLTRLDVPEVLIPSVTIYTAAWNSPRRIVQTDGWSSNAWKGPRDTVIIDYSRYYHSTRDVPSLTTEREPFNMVWAVKAVGIAMLRLAWK